MTDKHRRDVRAAIDAYREKIKADPGGARARLIATGIWDKDGELTPEYGGQAKKKKVKAHA